MAAPVSLVESAEQREVRLRKLSIRERVLTWARTMRDVVAGAKNAAWQQYQTGRLEKLQLALDMWAFRPATEQTEDALIEEIEVCEAMITPFPENIGIEIQAIPTIPDEGEPADDMIAQADSQLSQRAQELYVAGLDRIDPERDRWLDTLHLATFSVEDQLRDSLHALRRRARYKEFDPAQKWEADDLEALYNTHLLLADPVNAQRVRRNARIYRRAHGRVPMAGSRVDTLPLLFPLSLRP